MLKKSVIAAALFSASLVSGCASVPMASNEEDSSHKQFTMPPKDRAGLYVYRDDVMGAGLKKNVYLDGRFIGETASRVYFYKEIESGEHQLSTESEFGDNSIRIVVEGGKNYFVEQYIRPGVFVGGANLKLVSEQEGMADVKKCKLAQ